ncbi:MAG TPA: SIR2 family protein, partial [Pyrinomonadaceae bacterium]|nr:SIR2 family protein [Pyrinomonadaceae bacterium]
EPDLTITDAPDLPALIHYIRQGRCALFVGSGLSAGAGLPTWRGLMTRIICEATPFAVPPEKANDLSAATKRIEQANPRVDNPLTRDEMVKLFNKILGTASCKDLFGRKGSIDLSYSTAYRHAVNRVERDTKIARELTSLLDAGKFAELAGYCRDLMGRREFHAELRRALKVPGDIPETHHAIVDTPYACIVTTNYDTLLEDAYACWSRRGVPKAPTGAELAQQGTLLFDEVFFILKAHGDLDDDASVVLTSEDYRRIIHSSPAFQAMLGGILQRYAVLFVGYSLSDVNFRLLLDNQLTIFNEYVPPRYAIMEAVSEAEKEILWRTAKLRVINYPKDEHKVVHHFLRMLATQAVKPAAGDERAPRVTEPVRVMPRPRPVPHVDLEISASGERLALHLEEEASGVRQSIWSGGSQWPDWPWLRQSLSGIDWDSGLAEINAIGAHLERAMPDELLRRLEATDPGLPVMLSLSPATETIPWEWIIVEGSPLCLRNPVIRRRTGISDRSRGLRLAGKPLRALVIGDAGAGDKSDLGRLPGAALEAQSIANLLTEKGHEVTLLSREQAVYSRLVQEVEHGEYDIIHFAGHAWYEREEGLLYLWDGRVSSSELASILNRRPPVLLVLNSHYTAFAPCGIVFNNTRRADDASPPGVDHPLPPPLGFMGLASRSGVGAFVGCFGGQVLDDSACQVAIELYQQLLNGSNFAMALHVARKKATNVSDTTGLFYIGSGYCEVTLA